MRNKLVKGLISVVGIVIFGVLSIVEIVIEIIYQLARLLKCGYRYCMNKILKWMRLIYENKPQTKEIEEKDSIITYEFDLNEEF